MDSCLGAGLLMALIIDRFRCGKGDAGLLSAGHVRQNAIAEEVTHVPLGLSAAWW